MENEVSEVTVEAKENNNVDYPAAQIISEACFQDYMRLQDNYNKLYEKINIALTFAGVALTLVLGFLDFSHLSSKVSDYGIMQLILVMVYTLCEVACVAFLLYAIVRLLILMRSKTLLVFKSEDTRDVDIYGATENQAAVWLIDKYTTCTNENRRIIAKKQAAFEKAVTAIIVGLILFAVAIGIGKAGVI